MNDIIERFLYTHFQTLRKRTMMQSIQKRDFNFNLNYSLHFLKRFARLFHDTKSKSMFY